MRLKILFLQGVPRFGGALVSLFYIMKLPEIEPILVTSRRGKLTELCDTEDIPYYLVSLPMWRKFKSWIKIPVSIFRLAKIAVRKDVSFIYANTLWDIPYAVVVAKITGGKAIGHIRNTFSHDKIKKYLLKFSDCLFCVSFAVAEPLLSEALKCRVVYNGVPVYDSCRRSFSDNVIVSLVGRIDSTKGQDVAIRSIAELSGKIENIKLIVIGEESYLEKGLLNRLKGMVFKYNLNNKVEFLGHKSDVYSFLGSSDLSIIPSKPSSNEGFCRVVAESNMCFLPVVASNVGGIGEVVRDKITGVLVEPDRVEEMAKTLEVYWKNPLLRRKHGLNGRKLVLRRFELKEVSKQLLLYLHRCL